MQITKTLRRIKSGTYRGYRYPYGTPEISLDVWLNVFSIVSLGQKILVATAIFFGS